MHQQKRWTVRGHTSHSTTNYSLSKAYKLPQPCKPSRNHTEALGLRQRPTSSANALVTTAATNSGVAVSVSSNDAAVISVVGTGVVGGSVEVVVGTVVVSGGGEGAVVAASV